MGAIIDYFIKQEIAQDIESLHRGHLIVFAGITAAMVRLVYAGVFYKIDRLMLSSLCLGSALLFLATLFILKRTKSIAISGNMILLNALFVMVIKTYYSGNINSVMNVWIFVIPIGGAMLLGRKGSVIWGSVACSVIICFLLLYKSGYAFAKPLDMTTDDKVLFDFGSKFVITLFVTVSLFYYESILNKTYKQVTKLAGRQAVITALHPTMETMATTSETLTNNSVEMSSLAGRLVEKSQTMTQRLQTVAAASQQISASIATTASTSEEMSVSITNISSTSGEMARNVNAVVSATEEISAGINNIAQNARRGKDVSMRATQLVKEVTTTINMLGDATQNIGQITQFIKQIADQTNLLALNATIEAASAGNAGKGFAVIANEIKELAGQSGQASEKIEDQIKAVQRQTEDAITQISQVVEVITLINRSSLSITSAVEQHHRTSDETATNLQQAGNGVMSIAANIAEIARGAEDMSANAGQTDISASQVASHIRSVSLAASETEASYQKVNESAAELAEIAQKLNRMADQFQDRYFDKA